MSDDGDEDLNEYEIEEDEEDNLNKTYTEEERNKLYFDENEDDENEKWVAENYKTASKTTRKSDIHLSCPGCFTLLCIECQKHSSYHNQYRAIEVRNCVINTNDSITYNDKKEKKIHSLNKNNNRNSNRNNNNRNRNNVNKGDAQQVEVKLENTHISEDNEEDYEYSEDSDSSEEEKEENEDDTESDDEDEVYKVVKCSVCDTHVAMFDKDEIYHFFNVFPS